MSTFKVCKSSARNMNKLSVQKEKGMANDDIKFN